MDGTSEAATIVHPFDAGVLQLQADLGVVRAPCQPPALMPRLQSDLHPISLMLEGT